MGYKLTPRTLKLIFDGEYEGAEVRVTLDHPLGVFIEAQKLQVSQDIEGLCKFVAGILIDWNLEDETGAIPTTYNGVIRVYPTFINLVVTKWMQAQTELPLASSAK